MSKGTQVGVYALYGDKRGSDHSDYSTGSLGGFGRKRGWTWSLGPDLKTVTLCKSVGICEVRYCGLY